MKRLATLIGCALLLAAAAFAQTPSITKIQNNYGWQLAGMPNYGIAQGSIFAIIGTNLGPATLVSASGYPLTTTLSGVSASVAANGQTFQVPLYYVWTNAIAGVLPSNTPVGDWTLTVNNGSASGTATIHVVARAFGLDAMNGGGSGTVVAQNFSVSATAPPLLGFNQAAHAGETLVLYGTGLGASTNDTQLNNTVQNWATTIPVSVCFGGTCITPDYAGRSAYYPGLDQINLKVPAGIQGCNVSLYVQMGSGPSASPSNMVTIPVASGNSRTCSDPNGLQSSDIDLLASKADGYRFGVVSLDRSSYDLGVSIPGFSSVFTNDSGSASFMKIVPVGGVVAQNPFTSVSIGSCTVIQTPASCTTTTPTLNTNGLDAGPQITVNGPKGVKQLTLSNATQKGYYNADLSAGPTPGQSVPYLDAGAYTITGPGGTDVGSFTMNLTMPPTLTWTNRDSISTIPRTTGLGLTWTGGDPNAPITIMGISSTGSTACGSVSSAMFLCMVQNNGGFTVPAAVLGMLPVGSTSSGNPNGMLMLGSSTTTRVTPPPSGLDVMYGYTQSVSGKMVTWQ